jgi:hypothetical protein
MTRFLTAKHQMDHGGAYSSLEPLPNPALKLKPNKYSPQTAVRSKEIAKAERRLLFNQRKGKTYAAD